QLTVSVRNRHAANLTVAVVDYDARGQARVVTRGWADPQNHDGLSQGELLNPAQKYQVNFSLEPKQYTFAKGSRIGVVILATDYDHTLRPEPGTEIELTLGDKSFIELALSGE